MNEYLDNVLTAEVIVSKYDIIFDEETKKKRRVWRHMRYYPKWTPERQLAWDIYFLEMKRPNMKNWKGWTWWHDKRGKNAEIRVTNVPQSKDHLMKTWIFWQEMQEHLQMDAEEAFKEMCRANHWNQKLTKQMFKWKGKYDD